MSSYKIIGGDGKEYGPVPAEQLRHWIVEGRANAQTKVKAEDEAFWGNLGELSEFSAALEGRSGSTSDGGSGPLTEDQILSREPVVDIGQCLGRGWELWTRNFGSTFVAALVVWIVDVATNLIPMVGWFLPVFLRGVMLGGLCVFFLKLVRGQRAHVDDVFSGFRERFVHLVIASILVHGAVAVGVACCFVLPGVYLLVAWFFSFALVADRNMDFWPAMEFSRRVTTRAWFQTGALLVLAFLPCLLFQCFLFWKVMLLVFTVVEPSITPEPAKLLELAKRVVIEFAGLFLIGKLLWLLNLSFAIGALMQAYENLFGNRPAKTP